MAKKSPEAPSTREAPSTTGSEIGAFVAAFALLLAQLATALFTEQHKGLRPAFINSYTLVAVLTTIVIILITVFARRHTGTWVTGIWISLSSLALLSLFIYFSRTSGLPGQTPLPLAAARYRVIDPAKMGNKLSGVEAIIPISDQNLTDSQAATAESGQLVLLIKWDSSAYPDWQLNEAQVFEVSQSGVSIDTAASAEPQTGNQKTTVTILGFAEKTHYRVRLVFSPAGKPVADWLHEKDPAIKKRLHDTLATEFLKKAEATRKKMTAEAAVRVSVDP
jgi:hypothetical protein